MIVPGRKGERLKSDDRGPSQLGDLIRQYQARLCGFFRARTRNNAIADDLVQETWLEVMRHWKSFDPNKGSFWTFTRIWADLVLKRHWADSKREGRRISATGPTHATDDTTVVPGEGSPMARLAPGDAAQWEVARETVAPPPDFDLHQGRMLTEILGCVTAARRPPHEILVFLLSKLSWKPSEVVAELGAQTLFDVAEGIERDYASTTRIPAVARLFVPLHEKLRRRVAESIADKRTQDSYSALLDRIAGETRLQDYFGSSTPPADQVGRWWSAVERAALYSQAAAGSAVLPGISVAA